MRNISKVAVMGFVALALVGCDDSSSKKNADDQDKPNLADIFSKSSKASQQNRPSLPTEPEFAVAKPEKPVEVAPLPQADKSVPFESYAKLDSGNQLMFAYLALQATPIDYPEVLSLYSRDYARSSDEFKKHDLLKALTPEIDAEVAKAKGARYVKWPIDSRVGSYDFDEKGFPLPSSIWERGSYQYMSDNSRYKLSFTNGDSFRYLKPASEEDARKIESLRSKYAPMELMVYCFTQAVDPSNMLVKAQIVAVELLDGKGHVLATQK